MKFIGNNILKDVKTMVTISAKQGMKAVKTDGKKIGVIAAKGMIGTAIGLVATYIATSAETSTKMLGARNGRMSADELDEILAQLDVEEEE